MTAAARSFWPSRAGSVENRIPAPFGSEPSGRSMRSRRLGDGRLIEAGGSRQHLPEECPSRRRSRRAPPRIPRRWRPRRDRGSCTRNRRTRRPSRTRRTSRRPCRPPRRQPSPSPWRILAYAAAASEPSADAWNPAVGRSEAKIPIASAPSSPAKSGSHSAIVEPISAPTLSPEAEHRLAERDPVGDVGREDDHVRLRGRQIRHHPRPVREREVVGAADHDRQPARGCGRLGRVRDRVRVLVVGSGDRDAEIGGRLAQPARQLRGGERRRVRAEVGPARADAEDHRQPASGQPVRDGARLPVQETRPVRRLACRDRQVAGVRPDHDLHSVVAQVGHDRVGVAARLEVANLQLDPMAVDAAIRVDLVRGDPDAGELRSGERRGVAGDREDRADPDHVGRRISSAGSRQGRRGECEHEQREVRAGARSRTSAGPPGWRPFRRFSLRWDPAARAPRLAPGDRGWARP